MNVVFFIYAFYPYPLGATFSALRLARELRRRGHKIEFIVEKRGDEWVNGGEYEGFPVRSFALGSPGKIRKVKELIRLTVYLLKLRKKLDLFHIHAATYVNLFVGQWVQMILRRPVLVKITSNGWDTPDAVREHKFGRMALWFYRRISAVVSMTTGQRALCQAWGLRGVLDVIPNGVDVEKFSPASVQERIRLRDALGFSAEQIVLIYVGSIIRRKGIDVLLQAWMRVRERHENIALMLVGHYRENGAELIRNECISLGRPDLAEELTGIKIIGRTEDVEDYLRASDIFVFPSRQEGFGTVQIEAMACGLPCVVNDLPGINDDIYPDESVGYRITNNDVGGYVATIERLIKDPELRHRIGVRARKRACEEFSVKSVAEKYERLYRHIALERRPACAANVRP